MRPDAQPIEADDSLHFLRFDGSCTLGLDSLRIGSDGNIALPLVGAVRAVGRTRAQLTADIEERLARFLRDPAVILLVSQGTYSR